MIQSIRDKQPAYNLITNNCQTYALQLLDAIKASGDMEFGTTLAIYDRIRGPGKVADLFAGAEGEDTEEPAGPTNSVSVAQQVMHDNTTQLDTQEELNKKDKKKGRGGVLSFFRKG